MSTTTKVLIRVQARGGKYLGPAIQYSQVSVWSNGACIFGPVTAQGGSGTVVPNANVPIPANASPDAIVVTSTSGPPAGAYWLTPDDSGEGPTAGVIAKLQLSEPTLLEFRASTISLANNVTTSAMMWVYPGKDLVAEPGVLLTMPGLAVTTVAQVTAASNGEIIVTATVTMMCGCPITTPTWPPVQGGSEPYWPNTEFEVFAILTAADGSTTEQTLTFSTTSTFTGSFPLPAVGSATVAVCARQPATNNVGYDAVSITIP